MYGINLSSLIPSSLPIFNSADDAAIESAYNISTDSVNNTTPEGLKKALSELEGALLIKAAFAKSDEARGLLEKISEDLRDKKLIDNALTDITNANNLAIELIRFIRKDVFSLVDSMDELLAKPDDLFPADEKDRPKCSTALEKYGAVLNKSLALAAQCYEAPPSSWARRAILNILAAVVVIVIIPIILTALPSASTLFVWFKVAGVLAGFIGLKYRLDDELREYKARIFEPSKTLLSNISTNSTSIKLKIDQQERNKNENVFDAIQVADREKEKQIKALQEELETVKADKIALENNVLSLKNDLSDIAQILSILVKRNSGEGSRAELLQAETEAVNEENSSIERELIDNALTIKLERIFIERKLSQSLEEKIPAILIAA